jgi:Carboxypeptidase regulatory-like domain
MSTGAIRRRPQPQRRFGNALVAAALFTAGAIGCPAAYGGTLCGTVRDAATHAPIADAGIFLRTTDGTFTGLYTASAADGRFCLDPVSAGTYDLEVKVDDHEVGYRRVVVDDAATGVEVLVSPLPFALDPPAPNPARAWVTLAFELGEPSAVRLIVFDVAGRPVRGWSSDASAGSYELTWDLRSVRGRRVPAGVYFVHLVTRFGTSRTRLVVTS